MNALGELVELRAMRPGDADALWRWNHDPDVMRFMVAGYPQTPETVAKFLTERPRNAYGDVLFGVESRKDGKLIGLIGLQGAEPETGIAELNIYLGEKDYWGQGYATDAMRTACRYGFDRMRLHRIWLTVVAGNDPARHVYQKIGFVEEGRLRQASRRDGEWTDAYLMGLLAGELR
ncbi:RimJ/RimL family protein N-acetyltransferase [Actinoplanes octamycinicus]|uniref:RimJ/RimL family protein N-acetyltransferase n=1 Tax=Actinoplanes octamycinicus TaxID=135948 RepID=A0A7W7M9D2_9ACTN|nr:GNAT family N-acetyltransferase [Actinoplanes octamycinicus]MBB4741874.1 RimJ/RimL family protein N-acetyltransferase [Actinoplanes octamycinicus]GIE60637.1 N-acetyltransferase [Actinoplanes octamycinicus]